MGVWLSFLLWFWKHWILLKYFPMLFHIDHINLRYIVVWWWRRRIKNETYKRGGFCRVNSPYSIVLVSTYCDTDPRITSMIHSWHNCSFSHVISTLICLILSDSLSLMIYCIVTVLSSKIEVEVPWVSFIECSKNL